MYTCVFVCLMVDVHGKVLASYVVHLSSSPITVIMIHRSFALSYLVGCNAVPYYEFSIL